MYILFDLQENIYNVFNNRKEWQKGQLFHDKKDVYYNEYTFFFQINRMIKFCHYKEI